MKTGFDRVSSPHRFEIQGGTVSITDKRRTKEDNIVFTKGLVKLAVKGLVSFKKGFLVIPKN